MDNNELEKELLRQGELRINGILQFSKEIDDKIFKLLASSLAIISALLFFILNSHKTLSIAFLYTCFFAFLLLFINIIFLLLASSPKKYKGIGLPLEKFIEEQSLKKILLFSKDYYKRIFSENRSINNSKNFYFNKALLLLSITPFLSGLFYFITLKQLQTFFSPIFFIFFFWFIVLFVIFTKDIYLIIKKLFRNK